MQVIQRLAARINYLGNPTKRSIIEEDLNLPYANSNSNMECTSGSKAFVNKFVWENGYKQVADRPTRGDELLDVYLVRPKSLFTSCSIVQRISDHCGILLEVGDENYC
jgi:hypothetical protein